MVTTTHLCLMIELTAPRTQIYTIDNCNRKCVCVSKHRKGKGKGKKNQKTKHNPKQNKTEHLYRHSS